MQQESALQMRRLVAAGEPGVAFENVCTELVEYDTPVSARVLKNLVEIGHAMSISAECWEQLRRIEGLDGST